MRLSDFKDEQGIEVVAKLLSPIGNIAADKELAALREHHRHMGDFASALLQRHSRDVMDILAILDGKDPADYHCTAGSVLLGVLDLLSDPELMALFGLQRQTPASSGSASATIEAQAE